MPIEGAEFEAAAAPPVGAVVGARENARRRDSERTGASIAIGLVAIALAAFSAIALWLST